MLDQQKVAIGKLKKMIKSLKIGSHYHRYSKGLGLKAGIGMYANGQHGLL